MREDKSLLVKAAMTFGLSMGGYWVAKYVFNIWGFSLPVMNSVYWGLTCLVPLLAYRMTVRYRKMAGGRIGFFHAWQFGVFLYTFAAMIVSLMHYVFYQYIAPPELLPEMLKQTVEMLKQSNMDEKMLGSLEGIHLTPIQMAIQGIFTNIFYGVIFSLPVALLASRGQDVMPAREQDKTNE